MHQELAEHVVLARKLLRENGDSARPAELAADLRAALAPLARCFGTLDFGGRRKLLRIRAALDRLENGGLDRGERLRLDIELLGLWVRI